MTVGATLVASLLAVLERPSTWALALFAFLIRGGFLLVLAPIIVLPTAIGVANVVAPVVASALLSGLTGEVLAVIAVSVVAALVWLIGGGLLAAAAEAEGIGRMVAVGGDDGLDGVDGVTGVDGVDGAGGRAAPATWGLAWRILRARLAAHVPFVVAAAVGAAQVVDAAYREFTVPVDTVTPLVLRVARAVPEAIVALVATWSFGEAVGALAARRIVLGHEPPSRAVGSAVLDIVRRPLRAFVQLGVPLVALLAVLVPSAAAAGAAWTAIRVTLADGLPPVLTLAAVMLLVVVWVGQLVLLGLAAAWRGGVWTTDAARTFGGVAHRREGDWYPAAGSGTFGDPSGAGPRTGSEVDP